MALSNAQIRAIIVKRAVAKKIDQSLNRKAANDTGVANDNAPRGMSKGLLAACIAAGSFNQHARHT